MQVIHQIMHSERLRKRKVWIGVSGIIAVGTLLLGTAIWQQHQTRQHQSEVATRGSQVMPFDLEKTTHFFEPLANGGRQTVVADNPTDQIQIDLIQRHLQEESIKFQSGDFSDPATIHGETMPGLASLKADYRHIRVEYKPLPEGGQILYTTQQLSVVAALHDWFKAQLADHGHHASEEKIHNH